MKILLARKVVGLLLVGMVWLGPMAAWAHLPHPIRASGVVLAVDHETNSLVFKAAAKKPVVLSWNKDTKFIKNGQPAAPMLTNGTSVVILYKSLSFKNDLVKEVRWQEPATSP